MRQGASGRSRKLILSIGLRNAILRQQKRAIQDAAIAPSSDNQLLPPIGVNALDQELLIAEFVALKRKVDFANRFSDHVNRAQNNCRVVAQPQAR